MDYILKKFLVAKDEVCLPEVAKSYKYEEHTDELNFCVAALIAMVDEDN